MFGLRECHFLWRKEKKNVGNPITGFHQVMGMAHHAIRRLSAVGNGLNFRYLGKGVVDVRVKIVQNAPFIAANKSCAGEF